MRYLFSLVIGAFLLISLCGCKTAECRYPVGIYSPGSVDNYPKLSQAGFSHIFSSASLKNLNAAQESGLKVIATPGQSASEFMDKERIWKVVRKSDSHPALYSWYLIDEPDMNDVSPDDVMALQKYLKSRGVRKPTSLVCFKGYEVGNYAQIPDILLLDRYPVGWQPLETFGKHLRLARYAAGPDKPVFSVIQAFDWKYYPKVFPVEKYDTRPPTKEELRCMTWVSLVLGANGVFYYCYDNKSAWRMEEHPEQWNELKEVVSEVRMLEPLFMAEHFWFKGGVECLDKEQDFNKAFEPSILTKGLRVKKGNTRVPAGEYVVCVNTTDQVIPIEISLPKIKNGRVYSRNLPETSINGGSLPFRISDFKDGKALEQLEPLQIRIYGPLSLY